MLKRCPRCGEEKELSEDNFYPARPRKNHKKAGWQSFCKMCWKKVNKEQREKRKMPVGEFFKKQDKTLAHIQDGVLYEVIGNELVRVDD